MTDDLDDLDRALFALPLATPPAGLRASILRATIDAPVIAKTPALTAFETRVLGVALAVGVWLLAWLVADRGAASTLTATSYALAAALAAPQALLWLAAGAAIALVVTYVPAAPSRLRRNRSFE